MYIKNLYLSECKSGYCKFERDFKESENFNCLINVSFPFEFVEVKEHKFYLKDFYNDNDKCFNMVLEVFYNNYFYHFASDVNINDIHTLYNNDLKECKKMILSILTKHIKEEEQLTQELF